MNARPDPAAMVVCVRTIGLAAAAALTAAVAGRADRPVPQSAARLRAFVDGYGLADASRPALAVTLGRRARAMYDLLREGARQQRQPWARIWTEDGPYWLATADYLDANSDVWRAALE